ncbi:MAG: cytochrome c biogenesis protein CcdA [Chloroflexota bacterium]|nr:cytochrome c biogenesis protein CcdA [Chloroflexota bacterium]
MSQATGVPKAKGKGGLGAFGVSLLLPSILVVGALFLLLALRNGITASVASLAEILPVGYAFAAGMVSSVNPCGFFMLPSYLAFYLGTQEADYATLSVWRRLLRAFLVGGAATFGFVASFGVLGAVVALGGRWLIGIFPVAGIAIGLGMVGLGIWLLVSHQSLGIMAASRVVVTPQRTLRNVFLFGMAYAVGSLSCTLPIFLVVVGSALASRGWGASLGQFISYALGMGAMLILLTVSAALVRDALARWLRGVIPHVHRISALFLIGAGGYLVYYWGVYTRGV